jgi:NDP-sugar pyrophosphorylase family protein
MKALVLAAGEGQRLRPLTADRPKPMLPVGGRPLLEHIILLLKKHGVEDIAINLHYQPWAIVSHFGQGERWGVHIRYSVEERLLGSAGAARRLGWFLREAPFLVFYGDLFTDLDLSDLIATHQQAGVLLTMALYEVDNPTECGIVELDGRSRITRFVEKPSPEQVFSHLANAGVLVAEPEVLDLIPPDTVADLGHHILPQMLAHKMPIAGYPIRQSLIDIGTPEKYRRAQEWAARCL